MRPGADTKGDHMPMDECDAKYAISDEDLRLALKDLRTYVDVTEEDLRKIYEIALRHARERKVAVGTIMTVDVVAVKKDTGISEAAHLLSERHISGMPVVDQEGRVIGVVSEADILAHTGLHAGHTFKDVLRHLLGEPLPRRNVGETVGDVMSTPAITTRTNVDIRSVAAQLDDKRIKRLPVVDETGKIIGIVSRGDIVRAFSRQ